MRQLEKQALRLVRPFSFLRAVCLAAKLWPQKISERFWRLLRRPGVASSACVA